MKYLGIDYGARRVGIAVSDDAGKIAFPRDIYDNTRNLIRELAQLIREEGVERIIVGDTRSYGGAENPITEKAESFIASLEKETGIPISPASEVFSSVEAARYAPERQAHNDAAAAAIILQRFLDMHGSRYNAAMDEIQYDDFAKLEIRVGEVIAAEPIEGADKLLKCTIDFGEFGQRTIVSGIKEWKAPEDIIGKQLPYIVNLAPRVLRGVESAGMLLAASDEAGVALLIPERKLPNGTKLK